MHFHTTQAYAEHHLKTTPTSILTNPFFEHLILDVRRVLYDVLVLPPSAGAEDNAGLYLSCRQAKKEIDRAAAVGVRSHLLKMQREIATQSNGQTIMRLPRTLEQHVLPPGTPIEIEIYQDLGSKCLPRRGVDFMVPFIFRALRRMPPGRLEYHL